MADTHHDHDHHDHSHHHGHNHAPASFGCAFAIGIALNASFIVAEVAYGLSAHSLALLADAGHNLSDVLGLVMAWGATCLARKKPSARYTYGLQSSSIMAALANAFLLLLVTGGVILEAVQRLSEDAPVAEKTVMAVAACGILINGITAALFMRGDKHDLNIRAAFLHMAGDALVSLGVVIAGFAMLKTGWLWLDPAVSIAIALVIIAGTWGLLRDAVNLSLHAVPSHIDAANVQQFFAALPEVCEAHDLHIWAMSTTEVALSVHLLMKDGHPGDAFIKRVTHDIDHAFHISHCTIQIELGDTSSECALASAHVV